MITRPEGRVALVTGSTRGIGEGIAKRLALAGMHVMIAGRSENGAEVVRAITDAGGQARFTRADIGVETDVEKLVSATVREFGRLDVLVNNAAPTDGVIDGTDKRISEISTEDLQKILIPGLYGQVWACKYSMPHLVASGSGSIVNISSMASLVGLPGMPGYAMYKGALNSLSRQIAVDYADDGVRSNTIIIGYVLSGDALAVIDAHPEVGPALRAATLTGPGSVEDIAEAALFLAAESSRFITGSEMRLDGGLLCTRDLPDLAPAFAAMNSAVHE